MCSAPAFATSFEQMCVERDQIYSKVVVGNAAESDILRFQDLVQQINNITTSEFASRTAQISASYAALKHQGEQRDRVNRILFGGAQVTGGTTVGHQNQVNMDSSLSNDGLPIAPLPPPVSYAMPPFTRTMVQQGHIAFRSPLTDQIDDILKVALLNPTVADYNVQKYSGKVQKLVTYTKESINIMVPYRGYGPSSEAADIILGEKMKLKSLSAALYAQQKNLDEIHLKITVAVLQMAQSMGENDQQGVDDSYKFLVTLSSQEEADKMKTLLASHMQDQTYTPDNYTITGTKLLHDELLKKVLEQDNVVKGLQDSLHKYNHHSGLASVSQKVIPALLGLASMCPFFIGPIAKGAACTWLMATLGCGPDTLILKELYLSERLTSRTTMLSDEITMELAALDDSEKNSPLQFVAESLLHQ